MEDTELIESDILGYLDRHQKKDLLRFVAVGSVDDGKSTLIGRLLHDTHGIYEDQLNAVKRASARTGLDVDFSLFTDGLKAEREQGITIDVAYRYFSTANRKFIIADTPGHVQYTRNMATGASTADVCIILIDARLGVLQQSRRHAYIAALLGIPELVVCINKMDLVDNSREVFERIRETFTGFSAGLGLAFRGITFIPVSALRGDNVVHGSSHMGWYEGSTLLGHLEAVPVVQAHNFQDFRFPVQHVMRPDLDYRGFSGTIASGVVSRGDTVVVLPSGKQSRVVAIDTFDGELERAHAPMSVTIRLADEIDISRGDMLVHPDNRPVTARRFEAMVVWMSERPLDRHRSYLLKHTTQIVRAQVEAVTSLTNLETLEEEPASRLQLNDIGRLVIACHRPLHCDPYVDNRATGAFVLIDPLTNATVAAGMMVAEARGDAPADQRGGARVRAEERWERLGQQGCVVWLSGGSAADSAEAAFALERRLFDAQKWVVVIEGEAAVGGSSLEVARRCADAGLIVIVSHPSRDGSDGTDRAQAAEAVGEGRFIAVEVERANVAATVEAAVASLVGQGLLIKLGSP